MYKKLDKSAAVTAIQEMLEKCVNKEGYMVAMWSFDKGVIEYLGKVTQNYPKIDFLLAVSQLSADCCQDIQETQESQDPPPPLNVASIVKGIVKEDED